MIYISNDTINQLPFFNSQVLYDTDYSYVIELINTESLVKHSFNLQQISGFSYYQTYSITGFTSSNITSPIQNGQYKLNVYSGITQNFNQNTGNTNVNLIELGYTNIYSEQCKLNYIPFEPKLNDMSDLNLIQYDNNEDNSFIVFN